MKKKLETILRKGERFYNAFVMALVIASIASFSYAAGQPKIITGTVSLFRTVTTWILIIIPVSTGLFFMYHAGMKSVATDQAVMAEKNKFMKNVLIWAAVAECGGGIVATVLSFYQ